LNAAKSDKVRALAEDLYTRLLEAGVDVLLDDRDARPGVKFADTELIGIPHRLVISDRGIDAGKLEYRHRRATANEEWPIDEALARLIALHQRA
jgi:prolyl-tRNA synthetase